MCRPGIRRSFVWYSRAPYPRRVGHDHQGGQLSGRPPASDSGRATPSLRQRRPTSPPSEQSQPPRHSHLDCRCVLILIVARHRVPPRGWRPRSTHPPAVTSSAARAAHGPAPGRRCRGGRRWRRESSGRAANGRRRPGRASPGRAATGWCSSRSASGYVMVFGSRIDQPPGHPPDDAGALHDLTQQQRAAVGAEMIRRRLDLRAAVERGRKDR